jgi:prepilin signal peptidase PulO-like enzyme (type II secretory pathway)
MPYKRTSVSCFMPIRSSTRREATFSGLVTAMIFSSCSSDRPKIQSENVARDRRWSIGPVATASGSDTGEALFVQRRDCETVRLCIPTNHCIFCCQPSSPYDLMRICSKCVVLSASARLVDTTYPILSLLATAFSSSSYCR